QQPALEHSARHARVAHRAEQDRVVAAQLIEHGVGQRLARGVPAPGAQVVFGALDLDVEGSRDGVKDLKTFGHHFRADPVSGDDGETHATSHGGYFTYRLISRRVGLTFRTTN